MAPLMSRKTSPTQNQAITSRWIFVPTGTLASAFFAFSVFASLVFSAFRLSVFTMHHHRPFRGPGFAFDCNRRFHCNRRSGRFSARSGLAYLQLNKIGWVNTRIARRTEAPFGIGHGLFERGEREVAERIGTDEFANVFGRVR